MKRIKLTKKRILIAVVVLSAAVIAYRYIGTASAPIPPAALVQASEVKESDLPLAISAVGTLVAAQSVNITPEIAGHVQKVLFKDGTYVEAGTPLIQLDDATYRAQYESAKAKLVFSENKYKRMVALAKKNFVSQQTIDELDAELKQQRSATTEAEVQLRRMTLNAPFAGMVDKSKVNPGDYVNIGQNLLTLTDTKHLRVEYNVPEKYVSQLKLDQPVKLTSVSYADKLFNGKVAYISPVINVENRSIAIYAEVDNDDNLLKAGMFVTVSQSLGNEGHALMIPARSLMPILDGEQVYKVVDGKALAVKVTIGRRIDDMVQITQGLSAGDKVITDGQIKVQPGMPVKLKT